MANNNDQLFQMLNGCHSHIKVEGRFSEQQLCQKDKGIVYNAVQCPRGHLYCINCSQNIQKNNQGMYKCLDQNCAEFLEFIEINPFFKPNFESQWVKCYNYNNGCHFQGLYKEMIQHYQSCDSVLENCIFCFDSMKSGEIRNHIEQKKNQYLTQFLNGLNSQQKLLINLFLDKSNQEIIDLKTQIVELTIKNQNQSAQIQELLLKGNEFQQKIINLEKQIELMKENNIMLPDIKGNNIQKKQKCDICGMEENKINLNKVNYKNTFCINLNICESCQQNPLFTVGQNELKLELSSIKQQLTNINQQLKIQLIEKEERSLTRVLQLLKEDSAFDIQFGDWYIISKRYIGIYLSGNNIGDQGAASLAQGLKNLSSLTSLSLYLYKNQIGDQGAASLAQGLKNLSSLTSLTLDLQSNQIGHQGAASLAQGLKNLSSLTSLSLYLYENQIGHQGAASLAQGLKNLSSLTSLTLDLQGNNISENQKNALKDVFEEFIPHAKKDIFI